MGNFCSAGNDDIWITKNHVLVIISPKPKLSIIVSDDNRNDSDKYYLEFPKRYSRERAYSPTCFATTDRPKTASPSPGQSRENHGFSCN
jgi:hypothetical protein